MISGVSSLNNTIQSKLKSVDIENGLTADEAKKIGLTQKEIDAIKNAGVNVADDAVGIDAENMELADEQESSENVDGKTKMGKFKKAIKTFFNDLGNETTKRLKD